MEQVRTLILKIELASPKELGGFVDSVNREVYSENNWNIISVKASYASLLSAIDDELANFNTYLSFGNEKMDYEDCSTDEKYTFNVRQVISNLTIAKEFFTNPTVLSDPKEIDVNSINWNNREIFTAEEAMVILNLGETTYKRWVNDGWLSETQMMGSNKRYVQKKDIIDFINNPKIRKEAWKKVVDKE